MKNLYMPDRARIEEVREEAAQGVRTYSLRLLDGPYAGQPGQFNMVGYPGVGEAPLSLSAVDGDGGFVHTVRAVGRVTEYLARLGKGDELFLRGPFGGPWPLHEARGKDLVMVAGGLGMAPLRPVVHEIMKDRGSYGDVTLIYGAREPRQLMFGYEFPAWRKIMSLRLTVDEAPSDTSWEHGVGLVTGEIDRMRIRPEQTMALTCGPEIMMRFVARKLLMAKVPPSSVFVSLERRMKCGIAQCGHCQHGGKFVCKDGPVFPYSEVSGFPDSLL